MKAKRVEIVSVKLVRESSVLYKERRIQSPKDAAELLRNFLANIDRELVVLLCLNTKNEPTAIHTVSVGSLDASIVHPREVFKVAVLCNAASIVVAHNHPSGDPTPSREDIIVTKRLNAAGKLLGIKLLDHVIIGGESFLSLKERGDRGGFRDAVDFRLRRT